jgi:high-affinity iron transporter
MRTIINIIFLNRSILLASLLIVFREVLEAGLIVGIVLAATAGVAGRSRWVAGGIGAGVAGAVLMASFAGALSDALEGLGQEVFTVAVLLVAVAMLSWHTLWMASHGREMAGRMAALGGAVRGGEKSLFALAVVIALAVLREGAEVALFLYGIAKSSHEAPAALLSGGLLGLGGGALVSLLLYRGLLAIPVRHLFTVTNALVMLLAAGMAGQAAALMASIDWLPSLGARLWNSGFLLPEKSMIGRALHAMIGYSEQPSGIQVAAYLFTLLALAGLSHAIGQTQAARAHSDR